jgi:hypothetical protein
VAVLYVGRVITYLYFAPTVLSWQDTTPAQTTPALLEEVSRWMRLDLARSPVDWLLLAALLVVVVAYPRSAAASARQRPGPAARRRPRLRRLSLRDAETHDGEKADR